MSDTTTTYPIGTVRCDYCGRSHKAEFSHLSEWGGVPVFAAICTDVTDYYTSEAVEGVCNECSVRPTSSRSAMFCDICVEKYN